MGIRACCASGVCETAAAGMLSELGTGKPAFVASAGLKHLGGQGEAPCITGSPVGLTWERHTLHPCASIQKF